MFSRTNVRKIAEKRKQPLDEYCRVRSSPASLSVL